MKNTIVERNGGCPLVLTNAHLCSAQACALPRAQREERFQRWPCTAHRCIHRRAGGGAPNDPSVGVVGVRVRQAKWQRHLRQMNQPSRCERSVKEMFTFIHPRQQATPAVPPPPTWCLTRSPAHTHTIIFLQVRDSLTWWGGAHSVTCACILHGCCTHTEPHTYILSIDTIRGVEKLAHLVDIFIGTRSNLCKVSLLPVHWARTQ